MLTFHRGVSLTKAKKRKSAYLKISEQNPVPVNEKITWYILNFIEALAGSQMKVKAVLNNFCNFISNPRTTCVSCKEHIVFRATMDHVDFHKIVVFFQHGFRSKHSCETQLVKTIEDLAKGLNDKQQLDPLI